MAWTNEDAVSMDKAGEEATVELKKMVETQGAGLPASELMAWYAKWFMRAGHKRLGRTLVQMAKVLK